jgi:cobalt-zinc-cadmium efflux system membrane fusion protein
MFVNTTLSSRSIVTHASVPSSAILHLHDREWVFVPAGQGQFRRVEVNGGDMLSGGLQELLPVSGQQTLQPGQQVVKDVLNLEATVEAQ